MRPKNLAKAAGNQSGRTCSQSRLKRQKHPLKMCSSVARAGKMAVRSKGAARPQSVARLMFNSSSSSAATKKLKARNPGVRKASSNNHGAAKREERETRAAPRAKAKAAPKAAKARVRMAVANKPSSCRHYRS